MNRFNCQERFFLIACEKDTPRVVEPEMFTQVFDIQEKVMTVQKGPGSPRQQIEMA